MNSPAAAEAIQDWYDQSSRWASKRTWPLCDGSHLPNLVLPETLQLFHASQMGLQLQEGWSAVVSYHSWKTRPLRGSGSILLNPRSWPIFRGTRAIKCQESGALDCCRWECRRAFAKVCSKAIKGHVHSVCLGDLFRMCKSNSRQGEISFQAAF